MPLHILRGPFRGARIVMNPRESLRKMFGLYEHELNRWLERALQRVTRVIDVGANDGYFTFGCGAAFKRLGKNGEIIGFEPQMRNIEKLRASIVAFGATSTHFEIIHAFVGSEVSGETTSLDALPVKDRHNTLIKIDVEGAEMDVIAGAKAWLDPSNLFLIEVHQERFLDQLRLIFAQGSHKLVQMHHQGLPLFGREMRDEKNWWLVSELT